MAEESVLITGGLGFVGAYTAKQFIERGYEVNIYDRSTDTHILNRLGIEDQINLFTGDITDPTTFFRTVKSSNVTYIVHLAALLADAAQADPRAALSVNIKGTNNVFEAGRTFSDQIERIVWSSSTAVYAPPSFYDGEVAEENLVNPGGLYGATKLYNEQQARVYFEDFEINHIGLRPGVAYGPYRERGTSAFLTDLIEKPAKGESVTVEYGDQVLNWHYVKDMADAFATAISTPESDLSHRIYNVAGESATINEVANIISNIIPSADIKVNDRGELPWMQYIDDSAARQDLRYNPNYDLQSGLIEYINTVRGNHNLPPITL